MNWKRAFAKARFGLSKRLEMYQEIKAFLEDGISLVPAIRELHAMAARRKKDSGQKLLAYVYGDLLRHLEAGENLSSCINAWVPADELVLVAAGENVNNLVLGFDKAIEVATSRAKLRGELKANLSYPAILVFALFGFIGYFIGVMIPELSKFLKPEKWKGFSQDFYQVLKFFQDWGILLAIAAGAIIALLMWLMPRWTGKYRGYADKIFPFSLFRTYGASTFLIGLSALLTAGIPFENAIRQISTVSSPWMRWHMNRMLSQMRAGMRPEIALDTGLLDETTASKVEAYGRLSGFKKAIESLGRRSIGAAIGRMQAFAKIASYVALLAIAGAVMSGYYTGVSVNQQVAEEMKKPKNR